jgi:trans-aconitate 2-methyltransferase
MAHEFDGKKYELASSHQKEWGLKLITELDLMGNESVLDMGCGDGSLSVQIAELLPMGDVLGIDASQGMIETSLPKTTHNLRFLLLDINELDFTEKFDIIFSNATLHWVGDHVKLLQNTRRALRPGGKVRFNFAGQGNCSNFFKVIRKTMVLEEYSGYFKNFQWPWYMPSVDNYSTLVESSGLRNPTVWEENADRYFPDTETMIRWIDQPSLVPLLPFIPEAKRSEFRDTVVQRMIEETRQNDGRCFETFRRINLLAFK